MEPDQQVQQENVSPARVIVADGNGGLHSPDVDAIAREMVELTIEATSCEAAAIYLEGESHPRVAYGSALAADALSRWREGVEKPGADGENDPASGWLVVRLVANGERLGTLYVETGEGERIGVEDVERVQAVASERVLQLQNALLRAEVEQRRQEMERLRQQLVSVQEAERQRLAEELHDGPSQILTALYLGLGLLEDEHAAVTEQIGEMSVLALQTSDQLQQIVERLAPPALDKETLNSALQAWCAQFGEKKQLSIVCEGEGVAALPETLALPLYRFVQEVVSSVVQHSQARRVQVSLRREQDAVEVQVESNGAGYPTDLPAPEASEKVGLRAVQQQLQFLGGELKINPRAGGGARISVRVPL